MRFVDYRCNDCGCVREVVLTGSNGADVKCDSCGSGNMVRIFAPVGFKSSSSNSDYSGDSYSGGQHPTSKRCSGGSCSSCSGCN